LAFLVDHGHYVVRLPRMSGGYVSIDGKLRTFEDAFKMAAEESRASAKPGWADGELALP
jgi:hypothetical protein